MCRLTIQFRSYLLFSVLLYLFIWAAFWSNIGLIDCIVRFIFYADNLFPVRHVLCNLEFFYRFLFMNIVNAHIVVEGFSFLFPNVVSKV